MGAPKLNMCLIFVFRKRAEAGALGLIVGVLSDSALVDEHLWILTWVRDLFDN